MPMDTNVEGGSTGGAAEAPSPVPMDVSTTRSGKATRGRTSSPASPASPTGESPAPKKPGRGVERLRAANQAAVSEGVGTTPIPRAVHVMVPLLSQTATEKLEAFQRRH